MTSTFEQPQNQPPRKQRVFDEKGGMYELGKRIAEGGQGIVCPTQDPRFLVKVCKHAAGDPRAEAWGRQIAAVQRMPIDENDLPIAMPIALVTKPRPGYVMELMDGLIPLEEILRQAHEHMLTEDSLAGFLTTGGLARRLRLLARLARVLARLHGLGIAHGDLSPKNVFISRSVEHDQVWLIDCDNLTYAVRNSTLQIYTPDYGAPEIFRGELGISTYTDIWSFAVMAFQTLTLLHPFKSGSLVDADSDLETAAFRGDVAWVDHDTDDCNRAAAGIPREFVCTPKLATLFQRCFQGGLSEPELRPSMSEWAEVLEAAAALQIYCAEADGGCGSTFLWSEAMECPFCGHTKPGTKTAIVMDSMIFAHRALLGDDAKPADQWTRTGYAQVVGGTPVSLRQSPPGTANYSESQELASIWIEDGALTIKVERGAEVTLQTSGVKQLEPLRGRTQLPVRGVRLALHLGRIDIPHNVWRLTW